MAKGLSSFKGADLDEAVTRRLTNPIKGLAYWGAKDYQNPSNKGGRKGKLGGLIAGDVCTVTVVLRI